MIKYELATASHPDIVHESNMKKKHQLHRSAAKTAPTAAAMPALPKLSEIAPFPVEVEEGEAPLDAAVPFRASARFWKAVKLRAEVWTGLTAKTIPAPQWLEGVF